MIEYGRSIRWFNDYEDEIKFSESNGFDFMQLWFVKGELVLDKVLTPKEQHVYNSNFPVIIHALYDVNDYDKYNSELIRILKLLKHSEVIIHPICEELVVNKETIYLISDNIYRTNQLLKSEGVRLYVENNSIIDKVNYMPGDLKIVFDRNPDVELVLDIAHIDSYKHLQNILEVKFPKCLHISDKRFISFHEHLAVGQGELNFDLIFRKYLKEFEGKVIFEVVGTDEEIINSKNIIKTAIENKYYINRNILAYN